MASLKCLTCAKGCSACFGSGANQCTKCKQDVVNSVATEFYLIHLTNQCSTVCPSNQYSNLTSHLCLLCDANCLTCVTSSTHCLSCGFNTLAVANLFLHNNRCLLTCPDGLYANLLNHQCTLCPTGCALCFGGSVGQCTKCQT